MRHLLLYALFGAALAAGCADDDDGDDAGAGASGGLGGTGGGTTNGKAPGSPCQSEVECRGFDCGPPRGITRACVMGECADAEKTCSTGMNTMTNSGTSTATGTGS